MVNEDQLAMGEQSGEFCSSSSGKRQGARGARRARQLGRPRPPRGLPQGDVEAPGNKFEIVEVVGNWDDGTAQKAVADALAVHGKFDGLFAQGGSTGAVRALIDAKHKPISRWPARPRTASASSSSSTQDKGLKGLSLGQSPGLVAISMKAALAALQGKVMPQKISVPIPAADDTEAQRRRELLARSSPTTSSRRTSSRPAASTSRPSRSWRRTRN